MKIVINYESTWRNSFLSGDNNSPIPKEGRKFLAAGKNINGRLSKPENFIRRNITFDTVMGLLNRLIGDQRKLYQARSDKNYFFYNMEKNNLVSFDDVEAKRILTNEMIYIRNLTGSEDQNSFTGMIKTNDAIFTSDYSNEFWGVLNLNLNELCDFILSERKIVKKMELNPISILRRLEMIKKQKPIASDSSEILAAKVLEVEFNKYKPLNKKGELLILPLYCSAMYLQLGRLAKRFDMKSAKSPRGGIGGISNNGFTPKDFMDRYTTGDKKKIFGNPYIRTEFVEGVGKTTSMLTKASGELEINIDVDIEKGREIEQMIEYAGVSSFYLGKKGLAYVSDIRV